MAKLLIASANPGKQREIRALLDFPDLILVDLKMIGVRHHVEENGVSYADNAHLKASVFAHISGMWTLADDSGLEVAALSGAPGPRSARLGETGFSDADRRKFLLNMLRSLPRPWTARFRCVAALSCPEGEVDLAEGICPGEVISFERGTGGFGFDPIFLVHGTNQTMAELSLEEKNRISHRARAIQSLTPILKQRLGFS